MPPPSSSSSSSLTTAAEERLRAAEAQGQQAVRAATRELSAGHIPEAERLIVSALTQFEDYAEHCGVAYEDMCALGTVRSLRQVGAKIEQAEDALGGRGSSY